jgi:hypothetical protein
MLVKALFFRRIHGGPAARFGIILDLRAGQRRGGWMARSISGLPETAEGGWLRRPRERSARWLRLALQSARELELFTIPPYLCAFWSIEDQNPENDVFWSLRQIPGEEMKHLGLACNLLTAFGAVPLLNRSPAVPRYPGPLPGGVHPGLRVAFRQLSKDLVGTVFMQIEFPSPEAVTTYAEHHYPTIGALYAGSQPLLRPVVCRGRKAQRPERRDLARRSLPRARS